MVSERTIDFGNGLSVLDGVALVAGAAVASVHTRGLIEEELFGPGWVVIWGSFAWLAITAAGPFVYMVRKHVRKPWNYPGVGDRLWALLGIPWLLTAFLQNTADGSAPSHQTLVSAGLSVGLLLVSILAVTVIWATWVTASRERAAETFSGPWSNRLGLILTIAWPIQCGVGMVVTS